MAGGDTEGTTDAWPTGYIRVSGTSGTTNSVTTDSNVVWRIWATNCDSGTTTSGVTFSSSVWQSWNDVTSAASSVTGGWNTQAFNGWVVSQEEYRERTREAEAARRRREREWQERQRKQRKEREAASYRARKLLVEHLDRQQRKTLEKLGYFDLKVNVGGAERTFRIFNNKYQHNVFELDERGQKVREFCAHTSHACPQSDHALAQKLMLEADPQQFFRVANIWNLNGGRRIVSNSGMDFMPPQPQIEIARA